MRRGCFLFVLLIAGCDRPAAPKGVGPPLPTKEEVLGYLDGKEVPMPVVGNHATPLDGTKVYRLRRDQIEALEVDPNQAGLASDECHRVSFLANVDGGRFAVRGVIESRLIEGRRAFSNWHLQEVAKQ